MSLKILIWICLVLFLKPLMAFSEQDISSLVVDAQDGSIIFDNNSDVKKYPASLTKIMTIYVALDKVKSGRIKLTDIVSVPKEATYTPNLKIGLKTGEQITVQDLIVSMIVHSANDSAVALAHFVGGSEEAFVEMMNATAYKLKLNSTHFTNASGLHNPFQYTTARDMARLAMSLWSDFPDFFPYFSITEFTYNGKLFRSHNRVTLTYMGSNGLKTGYVSASGYNIVSSASKDNHDLIVVVMNANSSVQRDAITSNLLDYGFKHIYQNYIHVSDSINSNSIRI